MKKTGTDFRFKDYQATDILTGEWSLAELEYSLLGASDVKQNRRRIQLLSEGFLGTGYKESTLKGGINTPEVLVINLDKVDCFTFIDYVEAMRLSRSFSDFNKNLRKVRYKGGKVSFKTRKHFFTDWAAGRHNTVRDATEMVGGREAIKVSKILNIKEDGTCYIQGILPIKRELKYIPADRLHDSIIKRLKTGDYAGIYSEKHGLDVSHAGIIIKDKEVVYLRHASALQGKVIDEDFKNYINKKPGLLILRPV